MIATVWWITENNLYERDFSKVKFTIGNACLMKGSKGQQIGFKKYFNYKILGGPKNLIT